MSSLFHTIVTLIHLGHYAWKGIEATAKFIENQSAPKAQPPNSDKPEEKETNK